MFFGRDEFKFVFIGAGSSVFTLRLVGDLLKEKWIKGGTLALVDIDEKKLDEALAGVKQLVAHCKVNFKIERHTHYSTALDNADFVFLTYAVGSIESWKEDIEICTRHGVAQSVGDTIGPGGMIRIMRSIPVALDIAHKMEEVCPEAYIVNYTNPEGAQCFAIQEYSKIRCFGLCHGTPDTAHALASEVFKVDPSRFRFEAAGVNHLTWFTKMTVDGVDVYPRLKDALESSGFAAKEPISADLLRVFGLYPAPRDRHVSEFFSAFLKDRVMKERDFTWKNNTFKEVDQWRVDGQKRMDTLIQENKGFEGFLEGSGETAAHFIRALATGEVTTEMVNLPNKGYISNITDGVIVEVPAFIDSFGLHPIGATRLPDAIAAKCDALGREYKLLVAAAVNCDMNLFLQAAYLDPICANCDYPEKLVEELLKRNLHLLPAGWKKYFP
ncbi:alpha-glucosidase/alpha-galactosidase [Spirochaetia bacterium]|nr:alpha-glucosidase/alpha-galactosidase [Spirochaetia bacterium]